MFLWSIFKNILRSPTGTLWITLQQYGIQKNMAVFAFVGTPWIWFFVGYHTPQSLNLRGLLHVQHGIRSHGVWRPLGTKCSGVWDPLRSKFSGIWHPLRFSGIWDPLRIWFWEGLKPSQNQIQWGLRPPQIQIQRGLRPFRIRFNGVSGPVEQL
jgi:hypothetical protein